MPNTVVVHRPASTFTDEAFPERTGWRFSVVVNGRAGLATMYTVGTETEGDAAYIMYTHLMANPDYMEGVASTGGGGSGHGGSVATAGSGNPGDLIIDKDDADNNNTPKMKTADGT
jgi:hypothetical protein